MLLHYAGSNIPHNKTMLVAFVARITIFDIKWNNANNLLSFIFFFEYVFSLILVANVNLVHN